MIMRDIDIALLVLWGAIGIMILVGYWKYKDDNG